MRWVPMVMDGVHRCGCAGQHPILALSEARGDRWVNVRLTCREADHIARELAGHRTRAALTYTLLEEMLSALGWCVSAVRLVGGDDHAMLGLVEMTRETERAGVRAHPGDAIVLASRCAVTIDVPRELAQTGERGLSEPWLTGVDADEIVSFPRFLDDVTPEDLAP